MRVLARQGYARTSLMDIAQEAGMSKGAVHYHFPTKEALIVKVLEHACTLVAERATKAWEQGGDPLAQMYSGVRELWRIRIMHTDEAAVIMDLLTQSVHDASLRPQLAAYYSFANQQAGEYISRALANVGMRTRLPSTGVAQVVNSMLDGLMMQHFVNPDSVSEETIVRVVEMLAAALVEPIK